MITRRSQSLQDIRSNSRSAWDSPISSEARASAPRTGWRRSAVVILAALVLGACRPDMVAWHQRLAEPAIARLAGIWNLELGVVPGIGIPSHSLREVGTVALVLNRERVTTSLFGVPPMAFGTYDIPFDSMGVSSGDPLGTPDVWVRVAGDSIILTLSPKAKWPISLTGRWQGDSLVGRWTTEQRAGPSGIGDFVLRRR